MASAMQRRTVNGVASSVGADDLPEVVDLFSGVGGLSLGAARAGFRVALAVDNDAKALRAHALNFPKSHHLEGDVRALNGAELLDVAGREPGQVCGVLGGPPCQGFSRIGRRAPGDRRNELFHTFFRQVSEIRPQFYVAENVPGILDPEYDDVRRDALRQVAEYEQLAPLALRASDFGAATSRDRVFFIGWLPDHFESMVAGDFRANAGTRITSVAAALRGLRRRISPEWQTEVQGWRKLTADYGDWYWEKIHSDVPVDVGNADAVARLHQAKLVSGCLGTRHSAEVVERLRVLKPGGVDGPSRASRLVSEGFCPTLRAGTGPDHGSYQALRPIHPTEPRVITPREAARLQGFPDWFLFDATKWHSFRQIGNSVSPIIAEHVLRVISSKRK